MRKFNTMLLAGISLASFSAPAFAQSGVGKDSDMSVSEAEIVVSARRRDESVQDVPLVVNAVQAETLDKLNIREFKDVAALVPGLSLGLSANGIGAQASLRGVAYDVNASGNNGTIEFYMNDAHLSAGILFQSMFDVGQIEVLRGPQGTLRGRASPSGSITVTTRRPDLSQAGGYVNGYINDLGGRNLNAAINVPIIEDKLAIRIAGVGEETEANRVRSINNTIKPHQETQGGRISVRAEPFDFLSLNASYTRSHRENRDYEQVESVSVRDPSAAASPVRITAEERLAVMSSPRYFTQDFEVWNWQAQLRLAGQKIDYVGSRNTQRYLAYGTGDTGAIWGPGFPAALRDAGQTTNSRGKETTHEIRVSNEERLGGMFDYVAGFFYDKLDSPSVLNNTTAVFTGILTPQAAFVPTPANFATIVNTPILRNGGSVEKSFFGNVTAHIGDQLEISGGVRHINYHSTGNLIIGGVTLPAGNEDRTFNHWIYSGSVTYRINPDIMVYAATGSSWRPGSSTNSIVLNSLLNPSPLVQSFYNPPPETSKSYEIGFKSEWFDRRLRLNVTAYHQDFSNYIYSSNGLFIAGQDATRTTRVLTASPGLAVGVPAKVDGVEAELGFKITPRWDFSATVSYSLSKIKNGSIPCNDYFPRDGVPDSTSQVPIADQVLAANNGEQIALCNVNYRAGTNAPFGATVQSEFSQPLGSFGDAYLRGLFTYYGNSQNNPANAFDDVKSYGILNLYAGLRSEDGSWDIGVYAKNLFEVNRALGVNQNAINTSYQQLFCTTADPRLAGICAPFVPAGSTSSTIGQNISSSYRTITNYTIPREFGVNFTVRFGSR